MMDVQFNRLRADDYRRFRREAGWDVPSLARAQTALDNSVITAILDHGGTPITMARVIGDGAMNLYIQDVVTRIENRGRGHATALLSGVLTRLQSEFDPAVTVGLMAAVGQERLYTRFGFLTRPDDRFGAGMIAALGDLSPERANRASIKSTLSGQKKLYNPEG